MSRFEPNRGRQTRVEPGHGTSRQWPATKCLQPDEYGTNQHPSLERGSSISDDRTASSLGPGKVRVKPGTFPVNRVSISLSHPGDDYRRPEQPIKLLTVKSPTLEP